MGVPIYPVGTLAKSTGTGNSTLAFTSVSTGDCVVLSVKISSSTITASTVSGAGCSWARVAGPTSDTSGTVNDHEIWLGTVTTPSSTPITMTYSASVGSTNVDLSAQEFTANNAGTTWARDGSQQALVDNGSSTTVTYPSLTSSTTNDLYVGHARCPSASGYSSPIPATFVSQTDADGNPYIYGTLATAQTIAPTETCTPASTSFAMGVLITATVPGAIDAVGGVQYSDGTAMSAFQLTAVNATDLWVGYIEIDPGAGSVAQMSSTNAVWSKVTSGIGNDGKDYELWTGRIINAGLDNITLTFNGTVSSSNVETGFQEFTSTTTPVWTVDTFAGPTAYSNTTDTIPLPLLTARNNASLYWAYGKTVGTASAGSTAGYSYSVTVGTLNIVAWNADIPNNVAQGPTASATVGQGNVIGLIISNAVITGSTAVNPPLEIPYGEGTYGPPRTYGYPMLTTYNVEPMNAESVNYTTISVNWVQPAGQANRYRLLSNRYGFPVDENDGNILMDSAAYPGSQYADQDVIPGTYHYYGFYVQDNTTAWHRAGFTSCLAVNGFNSGTFLFNLLPAYFQNTADGAFSVDPTGDPFLIQYLNVIGWGLDYLKTQYNVQANHLNDPLFISIDELYNLAGELGMPFQAEIPASTMRKAVANWTHVCQERGTQTGIVNNITLLTDYGVDLRIGQNIMLEQDQSNFQDPVAPVWNTDISYQLNEHVRYGNYIYKCILLNSEGTAPTGTSSSNSVWSTITNTNDPANTLYNPNTVGAVNTWEVIYPAVSNGIVGTGALTNGIGIENPLVTTNFQGNDLRVKNTGGSTQAVYARSLSRIPNDLNTVTTTFAPDAQQPVLDGIPVPFTNSADVWVSDIRYPTNSIVTWQGLPFLANRASTGAQPPAPAVPLNLNYAFIAGAVGSAPPDWTVMAASTGTVALTNSTAQAYMGTQSMLMTYTASNNPGAQSTMISVLPGARFQASAWLYPSATGSCTVQVQWFDQFGNSAGLSNTTQSVTASTWTQVSITANAPSTAATAVIQVLVPGTGITGTIYVDLAGISCWSTPEWSLLSKDARLRLMLSAYSLNLASSNSATSMQAEWYNNHGQYISRVGRTPSSSPGGASYVPAGITYDSFTVGAGAYLAGRNTDTDEQTWVEGAGSFLIGEYAGGVAYPAIVGTRSIAVVTNNPASPTANGWAAVTFQTLASGTQTPGLVFRYQNANNYWFANMTQLWLYSGGSYSLQGTYSTPFQLGDRIYVNLNGATITVYRNGMAAGNQVLQVSSATLDTQTGFGIGVDVP